MKSQLGSFTLLFVHLFMQRLRRAGQEGYDFDQDQDIWRDDEDDQPPPGAPPGAGKTRTGIRPQPLGYDTAQADHLHQVSNLQEVAMAT